MLSGKPRSAVDRLNHDFPPVRGLERWNKDSEAAKAVRTPRIKNEFYKICTSYIEKRSPISLSGFLHIPQNFKLNVQKRFNFSTIQEKAGGRQKRTGSPMGGLF